MLILKFKKIKHFNRDNGFQLSNAWHPVIRLCKNREIVPKMRVDTVILIVNSSDYNNVNKYIVYSLFIHLE